MRRILFFLLVITCSSYDHDHGSHDHDSHTEEVTEVIEIAWKVNNKNRRILFEQRD